MNGTKNAVDNHNHSNPPLIQGRKELPDAVFARCS
jgi:hypothetical protein